MPRFLHERASDVWGAQQQGGNRNLPVHGVHVKYPRRTPKAPLTHASRSRSRRRRPLHASGGSLVSYFSVALNLLPKVPMVPRPWDRRVGFFTTPIAVGGHDLGQDMALRRCGVTEHKREHKGVFPTLCLFCVESRFSRLLKMGCS